LKTKLARIKYYIQIILIIHNVTVGRGSITTRYGLDGRGIESGWGRDFPHPASYTVGTGSLCRRQSGRGVAL